MNGRGIARHWDGKWRSAPASVRSVGARNLSERTALCSSGPTMVISRESSAAMSLWKSKKLWQIDCLILGPQTVRAVGIDYPKPQTIGPDRLANAAAVKHRFGAPAVVVDFGTAVTFDVVNRAGNYVGGIIAPGLAALTDYLHEKTALLLRITIREIKSVVGKSTEQAMLVGATHGYRGLIRTLLRELRSELQA